MRALAEFIMRGRIQASAVALVGNLVPMVSPATVGLVALRKNSAEGLLVMLWAVLPLLVTLYFGSASFPVVVASVVTLVTIIAAAGILKQTLSWPLSLAGSLLVCSALVLLSGTVFSGDVASVSAGVQTLMAKQDMLSETQVSPLELLMAITAMNLGVEKMTPGFVLGFLSWLTVVHGVVSLLLARWWQALLFNPGGFQQEIHGLRFSSPLAMGLAVVALVLYLSSPTLMPWASMVGFPLMLAGIGLIHHSVAVLGLGVFWLVLFYIGLLLVGPLSLVMVGIGFLDSILDFRTRLARYRK